MSEPARPSNPQPPRTAVSEPKSATVRIEHDRGRLLWITLASAFAVLTTGGAVVFTMLHVGKLSASLSEIPGIDAVVPGYARAMPWWTAVPLGIALLLAIAKMLRNLFRLQDADPAFVISARDLRFKPGVFAETVRIPWNAIRDVKTHRFKQHRSIILQIDDVDRRVARSGWFGPTTRRGVWGPGSGQISLEAPMSRKALDELVVLLQNHLIRNGRAAAVDAALPAGSADSASQARNRAPAA
ncbi:MAG TPA: hypothetical protein VGH81_09125 [Rudaea sp.]|jgi:hypothetical protein